MKKLLCPKCQLPIEDHEDGCPKRLSRRFFLGALGSTFGAVALAKVAPNVVMSAPSSESPLLVAKTKVHDGSYIVIDGCASESTAAGIWIAARTGRPVIEKQDGKIVRVVEYEESLKLAGLDKEAEARTKNRFDSDPPNWPPYPAPRGVSSNPDSPAAMATMKDADRFFREYRNRV